VIGLARSSVDPLLLALPFDVLVQSYLAGATPAEFDAVMWYRCRYDLEAFCIVYLSDRFSSPFSGLHQNMFDEDKRAWTERTEPEKTAEAAPRGSAKSTIRSFASRIHDLVYGLEIFIGLISTSFDLSESLVKDLYDVVKDADGYPELHAQYGPFKITGTKTDFVFRCPSSPVRQGTRVKAYSMGGAVRGHKHAGKRFSLWVLDDAERSDRVMNPRQRDKDESFIDADIVKSGDAYTQVRFVGTMLHPDSVLARKMDPERSPDWDGTTYQAIVEWPDALETGWEQIRAIWADLTLGGARKRKRLAREAYEARRAELDAGAVLLWPDHPAFSLFDLMCEYWADSRSFFNEKQNEPGKSDDLTFNVDRFKWVVLTDANTIETHDDKTVDLTPARTVVWWDPKPYNAKATGKDSGAFAVVHKGLNGGKYVREVKLVKGSPQDQWDVLFDLMRRFPFAEYHYENNTGTVEEDAEFLRQFAAEQRRNPRLRITGHKTTGDKTNRIAQSQPGLENGFVMLVRGGVPSAVIEQYRHFPGGRNDDGIDAVERALWVLDKVAAPMVKVRSAARFF